MALKFLNKKGWHTGSLRNIENVWKAEQKHDAEQKKLEELRKQIQEERERNEFRLLQEQAGLVPKQERLEFLYDSGLAVGRTGDSGGFKALEAFSKSQGADAPSSSVTSTKQQEPVPGALFEDKPQSSNDAWRKLHSDPLLIIRQREQEALARIKNNPIKMAMIRKSVKRGEEKETAHDKTKSKKKHSKHSKHSSKEQFDSEDDTTEERKRKSDHKSTSDYDKKYHKAQSDSDYESSERERKRKKDQYDDHKYKEKSSSDRSRQRNMKDHDRDADDRSYNKSKSERYASESHSNPSAPKRSRDSERENRTFPQTSSHRSSVLTPEHESHHKRRNAASKLSQEERAAKLKQMLLAAELHEEQRWRRIKKAEENDARESIQGSLSGGRNFLDAVHKSVYGAGEGGSSSISESVRRRTHYSQRGSEAREGNAFRR